MIMGLFRKDQNSAPTEQNEVRSKSFSSESMTEVRPKIKQTCCVCAFEITSVHAFL